jgi:nucleotide-binding universal stress UspA family protein
MAIALRGSRRRQRPRVLRGYRRLLVPVVEGAESERALELACRLAGESGANVVAVAVVEVPPLLPLDAHMFDEERTTRDLLTRAGATADSYGVALVPRILRSRSAGEAIVGLARSEGAELVVMGARRRSAKSPAGGVFGDTVRHVLADAPCRVVVAAPPAPAVGRAAA